MDTLIFHCGDAQRRAALKKSSLNGIDYLEVADDPSVPLTERQRFLTLHFVNEVAPGVLGRQHFAIDGGERVRDIRVVDATHDSADRRVFRLEVDRRGDFSIYTLRVIDPSEGEFRIDPRLDAIALSFKDNCRGDVDCLRQAVCPPDFLAEPDIDYLAKDYASFRRLMLDRLALLLPDWRERNPGDVGIALVELLAYAGDHLSYEQDAVATEAYLDTARRRTSLRRHARLIDYPMHDGRNARCWVQVRVDAVVEATNASPIFPPGTMFLTRMPGRPVRLEPGSRDVEEMLRAGAEVFEPLEQPTKLDPAHNDLRFYTWGADDCCLPRGATNATLRGDQRDLAGQVLLFVEARGPITGNSADAGPAHRHAVRVRAATSGTDPLADKFPNGEAKVTEIVWDEADALPFPLCLAATGRDGSAITDISIAHGNIVLTDHGRTIHPGEGEDLGVVPGITPTWVASPNGTRRPVPPRFTPRLRERPVTQVALVERAPQAGETPRESRLAPFDEQGPAGDALAPSSRLTVPAVGPLRGDGVPWEIRRDLLSSRATDTHFVVEVEEDGSAVIRFGDDRFGKRPNSGTTFRATYRVGNGGRGNIGRDTIGHIVSANRNIQAVGNPLPAAGGLEPERAEDVRQLAPSAIRFQQRAVTAADYAAVAQRHPEVQRATATMRWTGSWPTVFLTVDRRGGWPIDDIFETDLRRFLERFRLAGHDLEIDAPRFVPLEIALAVCVAPDVRRVDVEMALNDRFSSRRLVDSTRGLFHPDELTFGQPVFLSRLTAAAHSTPGVRTAQITTFRRRGDTGQGGLDDGLLRMNRLEVARLDNNPNFPERGVFSVEAKGGL